VTKLGLQYSLLTKYTSFIAVHEVVRANGSSVDVAQPEPMPAGVSDMSMGMEVGAEPGLPVLLVFAGIGLALILATRRSRMARSQRAA
jgi:Ca-activated chloride channel family protein